jgi:hypothetical protein
MDEQPKDPDALNVLVLERIDRTKDMARYYVLSRKEPRVGNQARGVGNHGAACVRAMS